MTDDERKVVEGWLQVWPSKSGFCSVMTGLWDVPPFMSALPVAILTRAHYEELSECKRKLGEAERMMWRCVT